VAARAFPIRTSLRGVLVEGLLVLLERSPLARVERVLSDPPALEDLALEMRFVLLLRCAPDCVDDLVVLRGERRTGRRVILADAGERSGVLFLSFDNLRLYTLQDALLESVLPRLVGRLPWCLG
jgi:hypothetical protein